MDCTSALILSTVAWTLADLSCSSSVSTEMMLTGVPFECAGRQPGIPTESQGEQDSRLPGVEAPGSPGLFEPRQRREPDPGGSPAMWTTAIRAPFRRNRTAAPFRDPPRPARRGRPG